jgi:hypothetical protein
VASLVTSDHTVHRSTLRNLGSISKSQRRVNLALDLPRFIMLHSKSGKIIRGLLPLAVTVARLAITKPIVSSPVSPGIITSMKDYSA